MAIASKKIEDVDLFGYILNGFNVDYNPFVSTMTIKDNLILCDLHA
jgi:hypothetical protein